MRAVHCASVALFVLALTGIVGAVDVSTLQDVFSHQSQADGTLQGAAVSVFDTVSFTSKLSGAFGYSDRTNSEPMLPDSMVSANTMPEALVATAVLKLIASGTLPPLDSTIPTVFLPAQVSLTSPHTAATITLRMLLTHTSTLNDGNFETAKRSSPTAVVDLRSFVTSYLITSSGGVNSLSSSAFTTGVTPGSSDAYNYARINTALLTYIVELAVVSNPTLVSGGTYTALAYVREQILEPLGMSHTITLTVVGGFPTLAYPSGGVIFGQTAVELLSSAGTVLSTKPTHPAYLSDYMTYTSVLDLERLTRALFLTASSGTGSAATSILGSIGATMKSKTVVSSAIAGVTATGLGITFFDGAVLCAAAIATQMVTRCPLTASHNVWGLVATGAFSQVGVYCTDAISTSNPTCVTTAHTFSDAGTTTKAPTISYALAGAAFQLSIGDTSTISQETVSTSSRSNLYGVWVFFGVLGVLVFVLVASYFTEYIIQPAPVVGGVPVPQSMMPQQVARVPTDTYFNSN
jgi:CubicO group peptidase (beta-lactamase class C family)